MLWSTRTTDGSNGARTRSLTDEVLRSIGVGRQRKVLQDRLRDRIDAIGRINVSRKRIAHEPSGGIRLVVSGS